MNIFLEIVSVFSTMRVERLCGMFTYVCVLHTRECVYVSGELRKFFNEPHLSLVCVCVCEWYVNALFLTG